MDYKFSVVMPLYNAATYLEETVESILQQSIGFSDNIQIIFVDDGSTDNTGSICDSFCKEYPENIVYVKQANAGVSAARNAGIPYVKGKYVNFMDDDDLWDANAFKTAWDMLEAHEEIDVVACRMDFFEGRTGYHKLDYKFDAGDMICDIHEHPTFGQYSVSSAFCRTSAIGDLTYDTRLSYGEDAKFIISLILKKEKYGLLRSAEYHIRRHLDESSLTQNKRNKETAYLDTASYYYKYLADHSLSLYGCVIPFIQHCLINAIKYRVNAEIPDSIPAEISGPYIDILSELILLFDDDVICSARNISMQTKLYFLGQKYGAEKLAEMITFKKRFAYINGLRIGAVFGKNSLVIENENKSLLKTVVSGSIRCPLFVKELSLKLSCGSKDYDCELKYAPAKNHLSYKGESMNSIYDFCVRVPSRTYSNRDGIVWTAVADGKEFNVTAVTSSTP